MVNRNLVNLARKSSGGSGGGGNDPEDGPLFFDDDDSAESPFTNPVATVDDLLDGPDRTPFDRDGGNIDDLDR